MTQDESEKVVEAAVDKLGEFFPGGSIQVLVSWTGDGSTRCVKRGAGNWYARQGMAQEFINADMAQEQAYQIAEKLRDDPDEGDHWKVGEEAQP